MKFIIAICLHSVIFNNVCSMPMLQNGNSISPYLSSKPGITNVPTMNTFANVPSTFGNMNYGPNTVVANEPVFNMNYVPNNFGTGNAILANEAITNTNMLANANSALANEMIGNAVITSANFVPLANLPSGFSSNFPMSPIISEIVPSLQYGDITMGGDLPIGGTIKVCGCFPVYGMVTVDGSVPSAGTAFVAESFGKQMMPGPGMAII
ncbi:uncharacterized protein LOC126779216 [Nymphalis io]|uniref:uncharacterized protein LOC126779216 n=1 Tax=Inachis io TaxID=171585 RepID=UPI0021671168|nr:uncharacterized protein LOC126779216 [Nymphalis io]